MLPPRRREDRADLVRNLLYAEGFGNEVHVGDVDILPKLLFGGFPQNIEMIWPPSGIADERRYYFPRTALVTRHRIRTGPNHEDWVITGLRAQHPTTVVWNTVGMPGFALGRERHIIDPLGLGDPLLARLPPTYLQTTRPAGGCFQTASLHRPD